jgi:hypothetical protein
MIEGTRAIIIRATFRFVLRRFHRSRQHRSIVLVRPIAVSVLGWSLASLALVAAPWLSFAREAVDLRAMFVPWHAPAWRFDVLVADEPIRDVTKRMQVLAGESVGSSAADAWAIERPEPFDAFGADGHYDRYRLARLFHGRRPEVARGPLVREGRLVGSATLISPYPNPDLTTLHDGTMIVLTFVRKSDLLRP